MKCNPSNRPTAPCHLKRWPISHDHETGCDHNPTCPIRSAYGPQNAGALNALCSTGACLNLFVTTGMAALSALCLSN